MNFTRRQIFLSNRSNIWNMSTYKITYFDARGRGEVIRLALSVAGQDFEDVRLTQEEWQQEKDKTPLGQLPLLEVDGKTLIQSAAIARYLARKYDLYGSGNMEMTYVDVVTDTVDEALGIGAKFYFEKDETFKTDIKNNVTENFLPRFFTLLNGMLEQNGEGWIVGSKLTIADLAVFNVMSFLRDVIFTDKSVEQFLKDEPSLLAHRKKVEEYEGVREYLAKRPKTQF